MKSVGIIGLGRFGRLLANILQTKYKIITYDSNSDDTLDAILRAQTIFIAVPIRQFESTIKKIAHLIAEDATIIDVCSVKVYPVKIMQKLLPASVDIIATHPLFGPDSFDLNPNKKIMFANIRDQHNRYQEWKQFFNEQSIEVVEMTPERHDQYMAKSQGITHLIGRALDKIDAHSTPIDTSGFQQLLKIKQQTCNDTWELFYDLQRYNPYNKAESEKLLDALQHLMGEIEK